MSLGLASHVAQAEPGPLAARSIAPAPPDPLVCRTLRADPLGELTPRTVERIQRQLKYLPVGDRLAFWAEAFVGRPYDTDPLGLYVRCEKLVCDAEVDCMYLVFRSAELALTVNPAEAEAKALDMRFRTRGRVEDARVVNYDERFQYAMDMIASGKWGREVTGELGETQAVPGARGYGEVAYLPVKAAADPKLMAKLKDGDLVFFVKDPARRVVGEIIGHLGVVRVEEGVVYLIHASGSKDAPGKPGGGTVKKVRLADYLSGTKFIGVKLTRFE